MASLLRSEALPTGSPHRRRRPRATADDRPSRERRFAGRVEEFSMPRAPALPRNLVGLDVLVVDDDEDSLEYFAAALRACGATVVTASAAIDALGLVRERGPHVVLSDIAMVDHDGYWLVGEIRKLGERQARPIPVVAATAFGREHPRSRALSAGFVDLLAKPVDPEMLCVAIAKAAGR